MPAAGLWQSRPHGEEPPKVASSWAAASFETAASRPPQDEGASVLPGVDSETDDGRLAQRLGGFQPVQALDQHEARAVGRTRIGVCWPSLSMLSAISCTRLDRASCAA